MTEIGEWTRWLLGGIATLALLAWRQMAKLHSEDKDELEQRIAQAERAALSAHRRADAHDTRIEVLETHIENGANERADIKSAIEKVDGKVDKLINRLIPQK